MKKDIKIYKGAKKSASVCCGSEVATALIDSCCGTQDLPDDVKIAFLESYIQELEEADNIRLEVSHLDGKESYDSFREFCLTSKIPNADGDDVTKLLPLVLINEKVKFVGRIPTGDELVEELETT